MTTGEALQIVHSLSDGRCPITGRTLPAESPYQHADVVRALHIAVRALERLEQREKRNSSLPEHAGRAWEAAEDQQLCEEFAASRSVTELAQLHKRTVGAIQSRLEKLGKLPPQPRKQTP
jgi:hypothetical protein